MPKSVQATPRGSEKTGRKQTDIERGRIRARGWLQRLGAAAAWCCRNWPELVRRKKIAKVALAWRQDNQNGHVLIRAGISG